MRIGIIGAMAEEVSLLETLIENKNVEEIGSHKYITGKFKQHDIVLTQSGIGKVCAASAALVLALNYKVEALINTGCAGGIGAGLNIGDIVLSTAMAYHDYDLTVFGRQRGEVPGYDRFFKGDQHLVDVALQSFTKVNEQEQLNIAIRTGVVLSGDQFIADKQKCVDMINDFENAQVTEMEGAAIAHVCTDFKIPCLVIRSVSDTAQGEGPELFEKFVQLAADNSAKLLKEMLSEL